MARKKELTGFGIRVTHFDSENTTMPTSIGYLADPESESGYKVFGDEKSAEKHVRALKKSEHYSLNNTKLEVVNLEEI